MSKSQLDYELIKKQVLASMQQSAESLIDDEYRHLLQQMLKLPKAQRRKLIADLHGSLKGDTGLKWLAKMNEHFVKPVLYHRQVSSNYQQAQRLYLEYPALPLYGTRKDGRAMLHACFVLDTAQMAAELGYKGEDMVRRYNKRLMKVGALRWLWKIPRGKVVYSVGWWEWYRVKNEETGESEQRPRRRFFLTQRHLTKKHEELLAQPMRWQA